MGLRSWVHNADRLVCPVIVTNRGVSDKTPCCTFRHIANRQTQITPPYCALNKVSFRHPSPPLQPGTCRLNGSMYPATQPHALRASVSPPPTPPRPTNLQTPTSNLQFDGRPKPNVPRLTIEKDSSFCIHLQLRIYEMANFAKFS